MDTRQISQLVLRQRLAELIEEVSDQGNAIVIESAKRPAAVLLGYDQYKSLLRAAGLSDAVLPTETGKSGSAD